LIVPFAGAIRGGFGYVRCLLVATFGAAGLFVAALGLLEEGGENAGEGDEETDNEEAKAHRSPEGDVARGAGLLGDVGVRDAAGDEAEEDKRAGEDVEVASHADGSILRRAGTGRTAMGHTGRACGPSRRKQDRMRRCAQAGSVWARRLEFPSSGLLVALLSLLRV